MIVPQIYDQISKADLIISDMSGRNANVFYETGYAHGRGKKVLLLTQDPDRDVPFDLKGHPYLRYETEDLQKLGTDLKRRLRSLIGDRKDPLDGYPHFRVDSVELSEHVTPNIPKAVQHDILHFKLTVENRSKQTLRFNDAQLFLLASDIYLGFDGDVAEKQPGADGQTRYLLQTVPALPPGGSKTFSLILQLEKFGSQTHSFDLRFITSSCTRDYRFDFALAEFSM